MIVAGFEIAAGAALRASATGLVLWNAVDAANETVGINEVGARLQLK